MAALNTVRFFWRWAPIDSKDENRSVPEVLDVGSLVRSFQNDTLNFARMSFPQVGHVAVHIGIDVLPEA